MIELGVNIDHVATLREARKGHEPDLITAAKICEEAGAHQITVHLREDRRHIQDRDVEELARVLKVRLNFEMGATEEIIAIAHRIHPTTVCLVPEQRQEVTTEGGLDVASRKKYFTEVVKGFHDEGILVSMFIDPDEDQVNASGEIGADAVELHTGAYANAPLAEQEEQLGRLRASGEEASQNGLTLHAGHGLTIENLKPIAAIPQLREVNIGHSIISRAIFNGLHNAVSEILDLLKASSPS